MVELLLQYGLPVLVAGVIAGLFGLAAKRRDARNETEQKTLPTWSEAMKENRELRVELKGLRTEFETHKTQTDSNIEGLRNEMQRQGGATRRVFRDVARQWVGPRPPVLDPLDIAILEDTLPASWRAS